MTRTQLIAVVSVAAVLSVGLRGGNSQAPALSSSSEPDFSLYKRAFKRSAAAERRGDKLLSRVEFELLRLRNPVTRRIPEDAHQLEMAVARAAPSRAQLASKAGDLYLEEWSVRGPTNVGGRTRAVAFDIDFGRDGNKRILAGGVSGGMFLSVDGGSTWTLATSPDQLASVTCLAQDPTNRQVWYYGTGEYAGNSAGGGGAPYLGHGIFKSLDGG
ncbi:MAG: hypothetical protein WED87_02845, partial [Dehalococcoidia bacterium]